MSSGKTHLLIGGVAGVAIARYLRLPLAEVSMAGAMGWGAVAASAVLATVPDIDEPRSWIAQRVRFVLTLACAAIGVLMGLFAIRVGQVRPFAGIDWTRWPWLVPIVLGVLGLVVVGPLVSSLMLQLIRSGAGGHRRLTHSGLVAVLLGVLAWWLWRSGLPMWAALPGSLAYGIIVHDLGDLVTPAGVPLLYPLSAQRIGLPRLIAHVGEPMIAVGAIIGGYLLLTQ